jgi:hypothetical protein
MIEVLGTIFGSIFGGGATGLLGILAQRWADYQNRKLDIELQKTKNDHEVKMREADAAILAQEWAARTKVAEVESEGRKDVADTQAFAQSFQMEPQRFSEAVKPTKGQGWVLVLLDAFRGLIRPGLTAWCTYNAATWWPLPARTRSPTSRRLS